MTNSEKLNKASLKLWGMGKGEKEISEILVPLLMAEGMTRLSIETSVSRILKPLIADAVMEANNARFAAEEISRAEERERQAAYRNSPEGKAAFARSEKSLNAFRRFQADVLKDDSSNFEYAQGMNAMTTLAATLLSK